MRKINNFLSEFCKVIIIIAMPVMCLVVFAQVILRYIFHSPFTWAEEAGRYLLVWICSVGAAYGVKYGMHISILFIYKTFRGHVKSLVTLISQFMLLSFFGVCFIEGLFLSFSQWDQITTTIRIPMTVPLICIPISFGIMILFSLEIVIEEAKRIATLHS